MANKMILVALTAMLVIPAAASADDYRYRGYNDDTQCQQRVNDNTVGGGLIGAGVGAIAGSQIAGRGNKTEGSVLGAVVGAVVGSQVGKNRIACDDRYQYEHRQSGYNNQRYNQGYYDRDRNYDYNRSSYNGNGYNDYRNQEVSYNPPYRYENNRCGWGTAAYRLPDGRMTHQDVYMCKQAGRWVIQGR
jgi:uncharacterized protein YcfJ